MRTVLAVILLFGIDNVLSEDEEHDENLSFEFNWYPIFYSIDFGSSIAVSKYNKLFSGSVRIEGIATKYTRELFLHSRVNVLNEYLLQGSRHIEIEEVSLNRTNDMLKLRLKSPLAKSDKFKLTLYYNNRLSDHAGPIHVIHSTDTYSGHYRPIMSTEFQPMGARELFPCIDLPRFKAMFDLNATKPPMMTALSNMPGDGANIRHSSMLNQMWEYFPPSIVKMSTYTMSVILLGLDYQNLTIDNRNTLWYSNLNKKSLKYKMDFIKTVVDNMESITGVKYMLPKLDHVLVVDKEVSGMESWGLITYNEQIFKEKGLMTLDEEIDLIDLVFHEIAHQWFGNLITCKYWCYAWLNECVTTYITTLMMDHMYPNLSLQGLYTVSQILTLMSNELHNPSVLQNLYDCNEVNYYYWDYEPEHYYKGAAILQMVANNIMTLETFMQGLKKYVQDNKHGSVIDRHLWRALESQFDETAKILTPTGELFTSLMRPWFENEGYPVVFISRSKDGLINAHQISISEGYKEHKWWIPLTYTTMKQKNFNDLRLKYWLKPNNESQFIDVAVQNDEWIILNLQNSGLYRVVYDTLTYDLLIKHLMTENIDDIHPINRAQLVDETFDLGLNHFINFDISLNLSKYLKRERHYLPFDRGMLQLEKIAEACAGTTLYPKINDYMKYLIIDAYYYVKSSNFKQYEVANYMFKSRVVQLACKLKIIHCVRQAKSGTLSIIKNKWNEYGVVPELRKTMWCTAVKTGNKTVLNYLTNKVDFSTTTPPIITDVYAHALLCANDSDAMFSVLLHIFTKKIITKNDINFLVTEVVPSDKNCTLIHFLTTNYTEVIQRYGDKIAKQILISIADHITDEECLKKLVQLADSKDVKIHINNIYAEDHTHLCNQMEKWLGKENVQFVDNTSTLSEGIILSNVFYKPQNTFFDLSLESMI
ncbi:aminopeptidase Ey-like [Cimex lectularius]|uniref:Aminopeptidase n=1 Tax=Cimex lectularius TaxID=79782 RepID=A0A8I6TG90_CIMLE|nr:aminopeptidase Ey-like [Cimex lectularius]